MATKNHYYVLVITESGPVFVTKVDYSHKVSFWNKEDEPLEFSLSEADDISLGLNINFITSYVVRSRIKLDHQPYRYSDFECIFKEKKDNTKKESEVNSNE